jgi:hypothetical protein
MHQLNTSVKVRAWNEMSLLLRNFKDFKTNYLSIYICDNLKATAGRQIQKHICSFIEYLR